MMKPDSKPSQKMRNFLMELADLMEKHHISKAEAMEHTSHYSTHVDGIEFMIEGSWDKDGNVIYSFELFKAPTILRPDWFREIAESSLEPRP